jgi:hypothetical protein
MALRCPLAIPSAPAPVERFVRKLRGEVSSEAWVMIETRPGEECQVDSGIGASGAIRQRQVPAHRLFVPALGNSRKSVRLLVECAHVGRAAREDLGAWAVRTRVAAPDNLGEAVLSADIYDPGLNPLYRDVLAHYGVTALPCRVRDPDRTSP